MAVEASRGAFPATVCTVLAEAGIPYATRVEDLAPLDLSRPELHALDYEWYFLEASSRQLAEELGKARTVTLIGMPTVARMLAGTDVVLIDQNPLLAIRDKVIAESVTFIPSDIQSLDCATIRPADIVAFDAPWYLGEMLMWLSRAATLVKPDGQIVFPLFKDLTRPWAKSERNSILDVCRGLGDVVLHDGALRYLTPLFEREALKAQDCPPLGRWRTADLVSLTLKPHPTSQFPLLVEPLERGNWRRYVLGTQVVMLRAERSDHLGRGDAAGFSPLDGLQSWTYPSVSLRDSERSTIDLWTSRNRVAQVSNRNRVVQVLASLADSRDFSSSFHRLDQRLGPEQATLWWDLLR